MKILNHAKVQTLDKLNFGCGRHDIQPDMINLDLRPHQGVDIAIDILSDRIPFKKNQFKYVRLWAILEHIQNWEQVLYALRPYCADGCVLDIDVPYYNSANAVGASEHVRFFGMETFHNFTGCENISAGKTLWEVGPAKDVPTFVGRLIPRLPFGKHNLRVTMSWFIGHIIGGVQCKIIVRKAADE